MPVTAPDRSAGVPWWRQAVVCQVYLRSVAEPPHEVAEDPTAR